MLLGAQTKGRQAESQILVIIEYLSPLTQKVSLLEKDGQLQSEEKIGQMIKLTTQEFAASISSVLSQRKL